MVAHGAKQEEELEHLPETDRTNGVDVLVSCTSKQLANQDRKQTSARKPLSGDVLAARQTGASKTRTAAPQNRQNEPRYHRKEARATCG